MGDSNREPAACVLLNDLAGSSTLLPTCDLLAHLGTQIIKNVEATKLSVVARPNSTPVLAALGTFDEEKTKVLKQLSGRFRTLLNRARHVGYKQIEHDCEVLGKRLSDRLGDDTLEAARFIGIPRGGLTVLGMLSYALDLEHGQLELPRSPDGPLVVVDDCALTGSRFRRFLERLPDQDVIFAPLYAHPDLCASIEDAELQVTACVNARDLHDYAPEDLGEDYSAWQARWNDRHPDKRYWIGRTEHLCFPWGEADTATWDAEQEEVVQGLSVVPPEHRLKMHSNDEAYRSASDSVQIQPDPAGPIRPTDPVLFGTVGEQTIVTNPDAEVCIALDGTAAAMWHALIEHGTTEDTLDALLGTYNIDRATLRADLIGFVEQLASNDLLHVPDGALA